MYWKLENFQLQLQLDFCEILYLNYNAVNLYLYVIKVNESRDIVVLVVPIWHIFEKFTESLIF